MQLSKKDWLVYTAVNIGVIVISLAFYIWISNEEKRVEEQRVTEQIEIAKKMNDATSAINEAVQQAIAVIQNVTKLDEAIARKIFEEAERYETLSTELIVAVMFIESSYNPSAVSHAGAIGIMQIMPNTGVWLAERLEKPYEEDMLYDPIYNIELGAFYLDDLLQKYENDLHAALTAYNRGATGLVLYRQAHGRTSSSYSTSVIELFETLKEK